jgi:ribosomal-protein-alanine acetyltransferase
MLKTGCPHYYLVHLRQATLQDLKEMIGIEHSSFGAQSYHKELIEKMLTDLDFHNVIVEEGEKKVGYATFLEDARRKRARLVTIAVVPEYRNRGLAKAMLAFLEEEMEKRGLRVSLLEVGTSNTPATQLYLSVGYRIDGTIPDYYGKGKDAFCMEKSIGGSA